MENITKNDMIEQPLVSIIVTTYNSSKYVFETLESAKAQTYQNIELIVSDDCSTDNTVEICREWIEKNKKRFLRTELITSEKNTGIPANCNRGVKAAQGEWVKFIAGDDILDNKSISSFVTFSQENSNIRIIASISRPFKNNFSINDISKEIKNNLSFFQTNIDATIQYKILLLQCLIHAPNVFIYKKIIETVGYFDEKYKMMEDYPFWLKVTKSGFKFYYLDSVTVYYRIHSESIYNKKIKNRIFNSFYIQSREFEKEYIFPNINKFEKFLFDIEYARKKLFDLLGINKDFLMLKVLYYFTQKISPLYLYRSIKIKILLR